MPLVCGAQAGFEAGEVEIQHEHGGQTECRPKRGTAGSPLGRVFFTFFFFFGGGGVTGK